MEKKTRTVRSRSKLLQSDSQKFLDQLKLQASQRPRPKSPPVIPIMPTHKTDSDGAIKKKIKGQSKKYDIKKQEQDESSKSLKKQKDELNKFYKKKQKKKDTDLDDLIKKLNEDNKLLEQQNEQNKLLEQQNEQKN